MKRKTKGSKALAIILTFALVLSVNVPMVAWGEEVTGGNSGQNEGASVLPAETSPTEGSNEEAVSDESLIATDTSKVASSLGELSNPSDGTSPVGGEVAPSTLWDGTVASAFAGGTGTQSDPYQIATGSQLAYLAQQVNSGTSYAGFYIVLTAAIDLGDREWTPIGSGSRSSSATGVDAYYFEGTFDGGNNAISHLNATRNEKNYGAGLFGAAKNATFRNVVVASGAVGNSLDAAAGVVAILLGGECTVEACSNGANISGDAAGGVLARAYAASNKIAGCMNSGTIAGSGKAGGIVCITDGTATIDSCTNTGAVTGGDAGLGGILGYGNGDVIVSDCTNQGAIGVAGAKYAGGIVGYATGTNAKVVAGINSGPIVSSLCAGGIVGIITKTWGIENSSNVADAAVNSGDTAGGIVGSVAGGLVANSNNAAGVSGVYAGGVAGSLGAGASVEFCEGGAGSIKGSTAAGRLVGSVANGPVASSSAFLAIDDTNDDSYNEIGTVGIMAPYTAWGRLVVVDGTFKGEPAVGGNQGMLDILSTWEGHAAGLWQRASGAANWMQATSYVARIDTTGYASLAEAVANAQNDDMVTLLADAKIDTTLVLDKAIAIDGAGHAVQADGMNPAINITTNDAVAFSKLTLNGAKRGIDLIAAGAQVALTQCTFNVVDRGITMSSDAYDNVGLVLDATALNCTRVSDYEKQAALDGNCRGISLWNIKNSQVTLRNGSSLNGFSYSINVSGNADPQSGVADTTGLVVTVDNSTIRGWTGMNVWGSLGTYNIMNSTIKGVNTSSGGSNSFAALVFNDDIYDQFENAHAENNTLNISDSTITNYQGGGSVEELLRIDSGITKLKLSGTVNFIDTSGNIPTALYLARMEDPFLFLSKSVVVESGATVTCTTVDGKPLPFAPSYVAWYYWNNKAGGYDGCYVADIADVFESKNGYTLYDGEYLDLVADAALSGDTTVALKSGESFTFNRKTFKVSGGVVVLPEGVAVKTDAANNGLFKAAEGCQLVESVEDGVYAYTSMKAFAEMTIDGVATAYGDPQTFIADLVGATGKTIGIKMLADTVVDGYIPVAVDQTVTLDMNGKSLSSSYAGSFIRNQGNLTISGNGSLFTTDVAAQGRHTIENYGNLVIENGSFGSKVSRGNAVRNYGTALIKGGLFTACDNYTNGGYAYAVANGNSQYPNASMVIEDATVQGKMNGAIACDGGQLVVKGGTYRLGDGTANNLFYMAYSSGSGVVKIEGGSFTRNVKNDLMFFYGTVSVSGGEFEDAVNTTIAATGSVDISGGTFKNGISAASPDIIKVTGGTFTADPSAYVAEGYLSVGSGSSYTVQKAVAKSGSTYYLSLQDALNVMESGATVTLVGESTADASLIESKAVTIDGGGYRISGALTGSNLGNVAIKNTTFATAPNLALATSSTATFTSCVFDKANGLSKKNAAATVTGGALAFRNCSFVGAEGSDQSVGIQTWNANSVEVSGCSFTGYTGTPVTLSGSKGSLSVINNVITGWGTAAGAGDYLQGRAMRLDMQNAAASSKVVVTGNKMVNDSFNAQKSESFVKLTGPNVAAADVAIVNNYWNGLDPNTATAITNGETGDNTAVSIAQYEGSGTLTLYPYYQDATMTTLVTSPTEQKAESEVISGALGEVKDAETAKAAANAMASASQETKDALAKDPEAVSNIAKAEDTLVSDKDSTVGATTVTGSASATATVTGAALTAAAVGSTEKVNAQLSVEESQLPADKQMPENAAKSAVFDIELHVVNESGNKVAESVQPAAPLTLKLKVAAGIDPQKLVVYSFHGTNTQPEMYSEALGNLTVAYENDGHYATLTLSKLSYVVMAEDSGTFEVATYKPSEDPATWTTPAAPSIDQVFAGWYVDSSCETVYTATTGRAYAKFIPLSSIITFKGGSLRMDSDASTATNLRFGYTITMPEGLSFVDAGWTASGVNGQGEPWTGTARATNKVVSDTGIIETNLLLVNVKPAYYAQMWSSTMDVTYQTADGTSVTVAEPKADQRSIQNVATYISASNTATAVEKEYAQKILNAIV